ncbi:MAG: hypothetical protein J7J87_03410 [Candidatus Diapherotrites archaeon]|nr:hypothetical protein [Candidatus Diapherotrites archaeon]
MMLAQYPWDYLRPLAELASRYDFILRPIVLFFSLSMLLLSLLAYRKKKTKRFALIALAFFFFSVKWALKVLDLFVSPGYFFSDASENVFELIIFVCLLLALFRH